jgi:DNA (cytosine-5)-methyltransferase 1
MAAETYFRNFVDRSASRWQAHLHSSLAEQVRTGVAVAPTSAVLSSIELVSRHVRQTSGELDLLAGGPPCQGFSIAGLRNPEDQRNRLPFEFLKFVEALAPKAVLIENVAGIGMSFSRKPGEAPLEQLRDALELMGPGYMAQILEVNARDFGVAQHRPRIMILGLRRDLAARLGARSDEPKRWSSGQPTIISPLLAPSAEISARSPSVLEALWDLNGGGYRTQVIDDYVGHEIAAAMRFSTETRASTPAEPTYGAPTNHQLRRHGPRVSLRFHLHLALQHAGVPGDVFNVPARFAHDRQGALQHILSVLEDKDVSVPLVMPDGSAILEPQRGVQVGRTHRDIAAIVLELATRKHSQRALDAGRPAPTMLSLPDDFVHPLEPRTLSVREMARIQSFPDSFTFYSKVTTGADRRRVEVPQYTQVGNAVPPLLAAAVGRHVVSLLAKAEAAQASSLAPVASSA